MSTYETNQKKQLIDFLTRNCDKAFAIDDIVSAMAINPAYDNPPGKSTIYRLMSRLLDDNIVKKFTEKDSRKAAYQIVGGAHCQCHMHMKCTGCGKLFHMSDEESEYLKGRILSANRFSVDLEETLIYGKCGNCK